jgi:hypothetical protein
MIKKNQDFESIGSILLTGSQVLEWSETRGPKEKYFFYGMKRGEIRKKNVDPKKARTIQTSMKNAANRQGVPVTIQNHKTYLLIKRTK